MMTDLEKITGYEEGVDEVANGSRWGGTLFDHMMVMRNIAHKVLVNTGAEEPDETFVDD